MSSQVMVEMDEPALKLADDVVKLRGILGNAYEIEIQQGQIIVTVQESDDPVQEVTDKLDDAGVRCICYEWDAAQHAAAIMWAIKKKLGRHRATSYVKTAASDYEGVVAAAVKQGVIKDGERLNIVCIERCGGPSALPNKLKPGK